MLNKKKPVTPGQRHQLRLVQNLFLNKPRLKDQVTNKKSPDGRNVTGQIIFNHRGGKFGKRVLRVIYRGLDVPESILLGIERDPNRTALIARVFDLKKKKFFYTIAMKGAVPGSTLRLGISHKEIKVGNRLPLSQVPAGSVVSLVGTRKFNFSSAAGTFCQLLQKDSFFGKLRVPSGKVTFLPLDTIVTLGQVSNEQHALQIFGKAGYYRRRGFRPIVRGVAKNPVDHPHGGGGGKPSVTPWGKPTKGQPTRKKKYE